MGQKTNEETKVALADFLYKDTEAINSLYAQTFQGNLTSLQKNQNSDSESCNYLGSDIKLIAFNAQTKEINKNGLTENIDPHDSKILHLFNELQLEPTTLPLSELENGNLVLLKGTLQIRNLDIIKNSLPIMESMGLLNNLNIPTELKAKNKKSVMMLDFIKKTFELVPGGIEMELCTNNAEKIIGVINENYLVLNSESISRTYGSSLPGDWSIIGILDKESKISNASAPGTSFRSISDFMSQAIREFINSDCPDYIIKPIVIYRNILY